MYPLSFDQPDIFLLKNTNVRLLIMQGLKLSITSCGKYVLNTLSASEICQFDYSQLHKDGSRAHSQNILSVKYNADCG